MALTHERRFARCFCRDSGNITWRYFLYNKERAVAAAGNHREPRQPFRYTKENIIRWFLELDVFLRIDIDTVLQHFKVQMRRFQCFKESGGADTADNLTLLDRITDLHHFVG